MVKKIMLVAATCLTLVGCYKDAQETTQAGQGFKVERLFTVDGCTVYRFNDARTVYFSDCRGSTQYTLQNGKSSTTYDVNNGGR